jgi:histidyl-tRNA synthetase
LGIERLLLLLEAVGIAPPVQVPDAFAVVPDPALLPLVMPVIESLRTCGVAVLLNGGGGSMKSQFKRADASGARFALIFGADELARGDVAVKPLRAGIDGAVAPQSARPLATAAAWAAELRTA